MVAGLGEGADAAVDAGRLEAPGRWLVEEQMVDADSGVAWPGVAEIIPEGEHPLLRVKLAEGVGPALLKQPRIGRLGLRREQGIFDPAFRLVGVGIGGDDIIVAG